MIFGIWLKVLPVTAHLAGGRDAAHADPLPAAALPAAGAGAVRVSRAHGARRHSRCVGGGVYRTAVLKGLKPRAVLWRHVLRNALLPTITVIATQARVSHRRPRGRRNTVPLPGIGGLIIPPRADRDFPMLEGGVLTVGHHLHLAGLIADLLHCAARSAHPIRRVRMKARWHVLVPHRLARSMTGALIVAFWHVIALSGGRRAVLRRSIRYPYDGILNTLVPPSAATLVRHRSARGATCSRASSSARGTSCCGPAGDALGSRTRNHTGPCDRLFPRHHR